VVASSLKHYLFSSKLFATARTPARATSEAVPTTLAPTFTVVVAIVTAVSATVVIAQPPDKQASSAVGTAI